MKNLKIITTICIAIGIISLVNCSKDTCEYIEDKPYSAPSPPDFPFRCDSGMDVAFVIDYTASMGGAIDSIKSSVTSIVSTIISQSGGNYRLSLSIYDEERKGYTPRYFTQADYTSLPATQRKIISTGPTTDQYLTMMEKFSYANSTSFSTQLAKINQFGTFNLGYGVDGPEPGGLLINEIATNNFAGTWRNNLTKLVIIVTDAPAGGDDDTTDINDSNFLNALTTGPGGLNSQGIQCILVTSMPAGLSNFETQLVDLNANGLKITGANLNKIAPDIVTLIEQICDNNKG